jgi:beta-mannanase
MVLGISMIPASAQTSDPLTWEQSCAAGDYNTYASELGTNLVAAGLQNSVIRLGWEMNGPWEGDFVGTTSQEQSAWVTCFQNEVTALRSASGEHFLIDWNPNSCTETIPYANYYPGNSYVDILGLDFYDVSCDSPNTALAFSALASVPSGLDSFEAFANAQGKPMSFPEWGLVSTPSGDDPGYVDGVGSTVDNGNFAFQQYFDVVDGDTMLLNSGTPLSVAAYQKYFGNS